MDVVVQWKLPSSLSLFVQRAGRAARAPNQHGIGILLVEKSAYSQYIEDQARQVAAIKKKGKGATKGTSGEAVKRTRKEVKTHATRNGLQRGSSSGTKDAVVGGRRDVEPDALAIDEGLLAFVQTTLCRRRVVTAVYQNQIAGEWYPGCVCAHAPISSTNLLIQIILASPAVCCDLCHPELLDKCRPPRATVKKRQKAKKLDEPVLAVQTALWEWRTKAHEIDYPWAPFGPSAILSDGWIDLLASVGRIDTAAKLEQTLGTWAFGDQYSSALLTVLKAIPEEHFAIASHIPGPSAAGKRTEREDGDGGEEERSVAKNALTSQ